MMQPSHTICYDVMRMLVRWSLLCCNAVRMLVRWSLLCCDVVCECLICYDML